MNKKDNPLWWHKHAKQWCKKIKGKFHYFGPDYDSALVSWAREKDYLIAGLPVPSTGGTALPDLVGKFVRYRTDLWRKKSEISQRTAEDSIASAQFVLSHFGNRTVESLTPDDWSTLRDAMPQRSPVTVRNAIVRIKSMFTWARESGTYTQHVLFGPDMKPPAKAVERRHNSRREKPVFTLDQLRYVLQSDMPDSLRAWIHLAINCGMYPKDISDLRSWHIRGEWLEFARLKSGVERKCWLWPETLEWVERTRSADGPLYSGTGGVPLVQRGDVKSDRVGATWAYYGRGQIKRRNAKRKTEDQLPLWLGSFRWLRHTFSTVASKARDKDALKICMGHTIPGVTEFYIHEFEEERLRDVCQFVRSWLFSG